MTVPSGDDQSSRTLTRRVLVELALHDRISVLMSQVFDLLDNHLGAATENRALAEHVLSDLRELLPSVDLATPAGDSNDVDDSAAAASEVLATMAAPLQQVALQTGALARALAGSSGAKAAQALAEAAETLARDLAARSSDGDWPSEADAQALHSALGSIAGGRAQDPQADADGSTGTVLVVEDTATQRSIIAGYLRRHGHRVVAVPGPAAALEALSVLAVDVILLDVVMPATNGFELLRGLKTNPRTADVPVVMVSSLNNTSSIVHAVRSGAEDYLFKPVVPALLLARVAACVDKRRARIREQDTINQLRSEKARSRELLLNILPAPVADRLELTTSMIADDFDSATVMFADLVGFTEYSTTVSARQLVSELNLVFNAFDKLTTEFGVEKVKTIGDAYLAIGGVPERCDDHAARVARFALAATRRVREMNASGEFPLRIRIGIHSGPVTAGVIGELKFAYDIWGATVNTAARLESTGLPGAVHVSADTRALLGAGFTFEMRDATTTLRGIGDYETFILAGESGGE